MPESDLKYPERLILFDGVCNLCNRSIQFIIRQDPSGKFKFASLQSTYGKAVIENMRTFPSINTQKREKEAPTFQSIIFIFHGQSFTHSTAIIKIMQQLGGRWRFFTAIYLIPKRLRDGLYNCVATHRYRWFGKQNVCMVPSDKIKARFIE